MFEIAGRRVLVTGGQRGLGAAFTTELLARGAEQVVVTARHPRPSGDPRIVPVALEVSDAESVERLREHAGDVSVVFNNAGVLGSGTTVLGTTIDDIRAVFDTNVLGSIRVAQAFADTLGRHESSALVDVHSIFSWLAGTGAYGASKAALWSITNSLRLELASRSTLVVGVHLSFTDTEMTTQLSGIEKNSPIDVARRVLDGLEHGDTEILVDAASRAAKPALAGPVEELVLGR